MPSFSSLRFRSRRPLLRQARSVVCLPFCLSLLAAPGLCNFSETQTATRTWNAINSGFAAPPAGFRMVQYSGHDGAAVPVTDMVAAGIGGVNLFMQRQGYLQTDQAWAAVTSNITAVKAAGLQLWMADDNGYPSGSASGQVVAANPAHESRCLVRTSSGGTGEIPFELALPAGAEKFVTAFIYPVVNGEASLDQGQKIPVGAALVSGTGLAGGWMLQAFALQVNDRNTQATSTVGQFGGTGRYPNFLNAAAGDSFVSLTHREYARRLGALPGKIDAFYTNEPNLMTQHWSGDPATRPGGAAFLPWSEALPARFLADHGYALPPMLPALFGGTDARAKLVRRHFHETVGSLYAENYSKRIADWCAARGTRAAGHPLQEEDLPYHVANYGDMFRFMEPWQVPACDVPMPDRGIPWNHWMPKYLSSIGQYRNAPVVAALLDPLIYRSIPDLVPFPGHFRRIVNMAAFSGVNQFSTYLYWNRYEPATYKAMNEYAGRLSLVLRGARNAAVVGVYYPIETFQANMVPSPHFWPRGDLLTPEWQNLHGMQAVLDGTARSLTESGIDFNWVHGDWLRTAVVDNGTLVVGPHRYSVLVLPQTELIPLAVASKLQQFEQTGGRIVLVNRRPVLGDSPSEHAGVEAIFAAKPVSAASDVATQIATVVPPGFLVRVSGPVAPAGTMNEFFTARFVREGRRVNFLVNNRPVPVTPTLQLSGATTLVAAIYNPADGTITKRTLPGTVTIPAFSSLLVIENPLTVPSKTYVPSNPTLAVKNGGFIDVLGADRISAEWFKGIPAGWSGGRQTDYGIANINGVAHANLGELAPSGSTGAIFQNVGTLTVRSDVSLSFTIWNFGPAASSVGVAIHGTGGQLLGSRTYSDPGSHVYRIGRVPQGTPVRISFWGTSASAPMGLSRVSITSSPSK